MSEYCISKSFKLEKTKLYDIDNPDDIEKINGFIDKEGNWYSVNCINHHEFAEDYLNKHKLQGRGIETTPKDILIYDYGWIGVTASMSVHIVGGRYNRKQRQTLKKWFKKYKQQIVYFCPLGSELGDEGNDDAIKDENDVWFEGGRD